MTVSKALRNEPDISEATKARIHGTADRAGGCPEQFPAAYAHAARSSLA